MTEHHIKDDGRVKTTYRSRRIARIGKGVAFLLFALAVALMATEMVNGVNSGQITVEQHLAVMSQGG